MSKDGIKVMLNVKGIYTPTSSIRVGIRQLVQFESNSLDTIIPSSERTVFTSESSPLVPLSNILKR